VIYSFLKPPYFLTTIEEYHTEINASYIPLSPDEQQQLPAKDLQSREASRIEVENGGDVADGMSFSSFFKTSRLECGLIFLLVTFMIIALKEGVVRIVRTFGEKLFAFKFPPRTAYKLQGFHRLQLI
jgi:nucleoporin NDC1